MIHTIETKPYHDKNILEVVFSDESDRPLMEILMADSVTAHELSTKIDARRRSYDLDMDWESEQHFIVEYKKGESKIQIFGNISNAFALMRRGKLISQDFEKAALQEHQVQKFLAKTKAFKFPKQEIDLEGTNHTELQAAISALDNYIKSLSALDKPILDIAISFLVVSMASNGIVINADRAIKREVASQDVNEDVRSAQADFIKTLFDLDKTFVEMGVNSLVEDLSSIGVSIEAEIVENRGQPVVVYQGGLGR